MTDCLLSLLPLIIYIYFQQGPVPIIFSLFQMQKISDHSYESYNPSTGQLMGSYNCHSDTVVEESLETAFVFFKIMLRDKEKGLTQRIGKFRNMIQIVKEKRQEIATTITREMGKPIAQSEGEVDKSIAIIEYYVKESENYLKEEAIKDDKYKEVYVSHQPLGPCLNILPWNFPIMLAFKIGVPALMSGNPILLKHSRSVPKCALLLQEIFEQSGFQNGEYKNLFITHEQTERVISDERLRVVKFVGSTEGGKKIAELCGRHIKVGAFELGGSDPFVVLEDADLDLSVQKAIQGRLKACGQSCNNSKRFIIQDQLYDKFKAQLIDELQKSQKVGEPMVKSTTIGPLSQAKQVDILNKQVQDSLNKGAKLVYGDFNTKIEDPSLQNGYYFYPMVIENVSKGMPAFDEELFGPVFTLFRVKNEEQAIELANATKFGLSGVVMSQNEERAKYVASQIECGNVFINDFVASSPKFPNGGVKASGYGRECYKDGLMETVNRKTVVISKQ